MHAPPANANVDAKPEGTRTYVWGDKTLAFHSCSTCGCITHWSGQDDSNLAVNVRLCDPESYDDIPIRNFDGADSWRFLN